MDINHVKEFAVLAEVENFLEASELLFISQSSLSKHIKALEAEVGAELFDRSTRHVRITEAGRVFLAFAKQVVALQYDCANRIRRLSAESSGSLTIGTIPIMAAYGITDAIAAFRRQNPDFSVSLIEGDAKFLKQSLARGECDLAFVRDDGEDGTEFCKLPFAADALAAVLPTSHPLVGRKTVRLEELASEDFMLLMRGSLLYDLCLTACREAGFEPQIVFTGQRAENIIDLVAQGMGVGLLMRKAASRLLSSGVALVDIAPPVTTYIKIYYRQNVGLGETARHFIDYLVVNRTIAA